MVYAISLSDTSWSPNFEQWSLLGCIGPVLSKVFGKEEEDFEGNSLSALVGSKSFSQTFSPAAVGFQGSNV